MSCLDNEDLGGKHGKHIGVIYARNLQIPPIKLVDLILKLGNIEMNLQEPTIRNKRYMKYVQIAMTRLWKQWNLCILVKIDV